MKWIIEENGPRGKWDGRGNALWKGKETLQVESFHQRWENCGGGERVNQYKE